MSIEFPLLLEETAFGSISDPRVPVIVATPFGPHVFRFLIDTGADFAVAPRAMTDFLDRFILTIDQPHRRIVLEAGDV